MLHYSQISKWKSYRSRSRSASLNIEKTGFKKHQIGIAPVMEREFKISYVSPFLIYYLYFSEMINTNSIKRNVLQNNAKITCCICKNMVL